MKRSAAFLLIITIILSLVVFGFADENEENGTPVTLTLGNIYSYSIPPAISMTRNTNGGGIFELVIGNLDPNYSIQVSLKGQNGVNDTGAFILKATNSANPIQEAYYQVLYRNGATDTAIGYNSPFVTISEIGTHEINLLFRQANNDSDAVGEYTDLITYTVSPIYSVEGS